MTPAYFVILYSKVFLSRCFVTTTAVAQPVPAPSWFGCRFVFVAAPSPATVTVTALLFAGSILLLAAGF
jgi:hypothetical protein